MVAGATNKKHFFFFLHCKLQGGGSSWGGKKNTTGTGRKLANALYFFKSFKITHELYPFPTPTFHFSGSTQLSWQTAEPSATWHPRLNDTCSNYIKPLELSVSARKFLAWARGWALSRKTGRGRPLWGEQGIALTQGPCLAGPSGSKASLPLRLWVGTLQTADRQLWDYTNKSLVNVRAIMCTANQSLPNNPLKGQE